MNLEGCSSGGTTTSSTGGHGLPHGGQLASGTGSGTGSGSVGVCWVETLL